MFELSLSDEDGGLHLLFYYWGRKFVVYYRQLILSSPPIFVFLRGCLVSANAQYRPDPSVEEDDDNLLDRVDIGDDIDDDDDDDDGFADPPPSSFLPAKSDAVSPFGVLIDMSAPHSPVSTLTMSCWFSLAA